MHQTYRVFWGVILITAVYFGGVHPGVAAGHKRLASTPNSGAAKERAAGVVIEQDGTWFTFKGNQETLRPLKVGSQILDGYSVEPAKGQQGSLTAALLDGNHFEAKAAAKGTNRVNCGIPIHASNDDSLGARIVTAMIRYFDQSPGAAVILTMPRAVDGVHEVHEAVGKITADGVTFADIASGTATDTMPCTIKPYSANAEEALNGTFKFDGTAGLITGVTLSPGLYVLTLGEKQDGGQAWIFVSDAATYEAKAAEFAQSKQYVKEHWPDKRRRVAMRTYLYSLLGTTDGAKPND